jgi:hypothetical protein
MMRWIALALLALLAACGDVEPFQGSPRPAPPDAVEAGERIGICYNGFFSTPEKVRAAAAEACGPQATPQPLKQDMRFNCPLLTPIRATFLCVPE